MSLKILCLRQLPCVPNDRAFPLWNFSPNLGFPNYYTSSYYAQLAVWTRPVSAPSIVPCTCSFQLLLISYVHAARWTRGRGTGRISHLLWKHHQWVCTGSFGFSSQEALKTETLKPGQVPLGRSDLMKEQSFSIPKALPPQNRWVPFKCTEYVKNKIASTNLVSECTKDCSLPLLTNCLLIATIPVGKQHCITYKWAGQDTFFCALVPFVVSQPQSRNVCL